jgi:hypothetical protein
MVVCIDSIAELVLYNNNSLAQIHIYFIFIVLGVHNTEAYYVETIPVVQEQPIVDNKHFHCKTSSKKGS